MRQKPKTLSTLDMVEGRYVNYFKIGYNSDVFVIDHFQYFSENLNFSRSQLLPTDLKLRLIASPSDARHLLHNLQTAIKEYEAAYGVIQNSHET
jgi:hypothetical protein